MLTIAILIILTIFLILFTYLRSQYNYWKDNGIPQEDPTFPMGNLTPKDSKQNIFITFSELYLKAKNNGFPFYGLYFLYKPVAIATDLEFIRAVMVKDFNVFVNRGDYSNEKVDPLSAHLIHLESDRWRYMRSKLTSTFTSGKMKYMFPTIVLVGEELVQCLSESIKNDNIVEVRDLLARFTTDVIGNVGFGTKCDSLKDPNNIFREMGRKIFETPKLSTVQRTIIDVCIPLAKLFRISVHHKDVTDFFMTIIKDIIDYREMNNIRRNDFMDLLIQLKNGKSIDEKSQSNVERLEFKDIAPQAFVFFAAGFETSSTALTYILYELAQEKNQLIQNKARNEITSVLMKHNNELTYDSLKEMTYIDHVINETLRKYPPAGGVTRVANTDYEYGDKKLKIPKGARILIPIYGIHHDPEYYPNPDVFDPDRFLLEEIAKRPSNAFLPFGDGPRNCIGLQFGKLQAKVGLVLLLKNFTISICERTTPQPIKFDPSKGILSPITGIWLKIDRI